MPNTKYTIEKISPTLAMEWLQTSPGNRSTRQEVVAEYAAQMLADRWDPETDTIDLDEHSRLINGHHRLLAVVVAEKTVKMAVRRGLPKETVIHIDTGVKRSVNDALRLSGFNNSNQRRSYLAATLRLIAGYTIGLPDTEVFFKFETFFKDALDWYLKYFKNAAHMRSATVAGVFIVAYKVDAAALEKFAVQVRDGEGLTKGMPAHTLREFLLSELSGGFRKRRSTMESVRAKAASAVLAAFENRKLGKLQESGLAVEYLRKQHSRGNLAGLLKEYREAKNDSRSITRLWNFDTDVKPGERYTPAEAK